MVAALEHELGIARDLHSRLVPRLGRRRRRRLSARDVLAVMQQVTDDADALATVELRVLVEELLARGRHLDGRRVTPEDLAATGLPAQRQP